MFREFFDNKKRRRDHFERYDDNRRQNNRGSGSGGNNDGDDERGTGGTHTFTLGRASNPSDDFSGTILGRSRIRIGGEVVWEGIPCSRTDDGVVGYYDVVGKAFCPANANFAIGPEI